MDAFNGAALLLLVAIVYALVYAARRALAYADRRVLHDVAQALDRPAPMSVARVVFTCRICRHVTQETAADLTKYLTALETGCCDACRAVIEAHEKEWTA